MANARSVVTLFGGAASLAISCSEFRSAQVPGDIPDAAALDASRDDGAVLADAPALGDAPSDAAKMPDVVGDSPLDFACTEPWTKPNRTHAECAPRRVFVLESGIADGTTLSIAVTDTNRVGIAYNTKFFADNGELHIAHFARPSSPATSDGGLMPVPEIATIARTQFDNVGFVADIAASTSSRLHVAYQSVPDNEISYATLETTGPPSSAETIATGIGDPSCIALGVLPSGDVRAAYYDPGQRTLFSKLRTAQNGWQSPSTIRSGFEPDAGVSGIGHVVQVIDEVGSAHVAFHQSRATGQSEPRDSQLAGSLWTDPKTLENIGFTGYAGFSMALGVTGQTRHAAYYVIPSAGIGADLHLARWVSASDMPTVEILAQQVPTHTSPRSRVAMATDSWGLLHLAIVQPLENGTGYLEYRRQRRVAGQVTWVFDIVDDNVLAAGSEAALVDIALDKDGRPHIAYYRAADLAVCYATRFDRP